MHLETLVPGKEPAGFSRPYAQGVDSISRAKNPCLRAPAGGPSVLLILQMRKLSLEKSLAQRYPTNDDASV